MQRPTIALCMIAKNEAHNLGPLLESVKGCFDEIHITDTGSTDGTVELIEKINADHVTWGIPKIKVHYFDWVDDFAKARNYSFSHAKTDYICWLDLDDSLSNAKAFIKWRDTVLHSAHYWVALYNYAFDKHGNPECKFIRERVVRNNYGFKWEYFVHEGILPEQGKSFWPQRVSTWWVNHRRGEEDKKQDHKRNVNLFDKNATKDMHPRMKFYHGKELVENGMHKEAGKPLMEALASPQLDIHDRVLAFQYAATSALQCQAFAQAIDICSNGLKLFINRAELWCLLGDIYCMTGQVGEAVIAYKTAFNCSPNDYGGMTVIYGHAYEEYPRLKLAEIYLGAADTFKAKEHVAWLKAKDHERAEALETRLLEIERLGMVRENLPKTSDVIITCPQGGVVQGWDEDTLKLKGHGGSETAAIEVAKWIKQKTARRVKIFHSRKNLSRAASGVEYHPFDELAGYLQNIEPAAHIAWRHSNRITKAPTYVWCHDLQCPGADRAQNYDKIVALSQFHKDYLIETNGVREEKIVLGFNGVNPDDFKERLEKDPLKVVFSSSPDRGLVQVIDIVKKAREISGMDIKLHCFYGFENMRKGGQGDWADAIEKKIKDNAFVIAHGMVTKDVLMTHFKEAGVWVYPADFIETFCITAIEALCTSTWPIVRQMGALPYTLKPALDKGIGDMLTLEANTEANIGIWANTLVEAIMDRKWEKMNFDPLDFSWEKVADFFIKEFKLSEVQEASNLIDIAS